MPITNLLNTFSRFLIRKGRLLQAKQAAQQEHRTVFRREVSLAAAASLLTLRSLLWVQSYTATLQSSARCPCLPASAHLPATQPPLPRSENAA